MLKWLEHLTDVLGSEPAVVVSVIAVNGSVPREVGTAMVVSLDRDTGVSEDDQNNGAIVSTCVSGTIGGGNLEHQAIERAVSLLVDGDASGDVSGGEKISCQRVALGPSLGQCCGGAVELMFEHVSQQTGWVREAMQAGADQWLCRCLDLDSAVVAAVDDPMLKAFDLLSTACTVIDADQKRWFCLPLTSRRPNVWLFGAGHVGQSLARQLALLDCSITWFDSRQQWLYLQPETAAKKVLTDSPEDEVASAPDDTCFIVVTHSHACDYDICRAVIKQGRFGWLGLIGSATKRQTFVKRLRQRGYEHSLIEKLRCPIGSLELASSAPSTIALSVAAELSTLWEHEVK